MRALGNMASTPLPTLRAASRTSRFRALAKACNIPGEDSFKPRSISERYCIGTPAIPDTSDEHSPCPTRSSRRMSPTDSLHKSPVRISSKPVDENRTPTTQNYPINLFGQQIQISPILRPGHALKSPPPRHFVAARKGGLDAGRLRYGSVRANPRSRRRPR